MLDNNTDPLLDMAIIDMVQYVSMGAEIRFSDVFEVMQNSVGCSKSNEVAHFCEKLAEIGLTFKG